MCRGSETELQVGENLNKLKGLNQAKIIKTSLIVGLFWLNHMTCRPNHVHRLELQKLLIFCAAHLPVRLDIGTKFPISILFRTCMSKIRKKGISSRVELVNARHQKKKKMQF